MRKFLLLLLLPLLGAGQTVVNTGNHRKVFASAPCVPPTMADRYAAYNTSNLCTGSVACTNGATVISLPDMVGTQNGTGNGSVAYVTGAVGGQPSISFSGASQYFNLGSTQTLTSSTQLTLYAVLKPSATSFTGAIIGSNAASGPEWRINSTGHQEFLSQSSASVGTSTSVVSTSAYSTIAMTYNYSTGALSFYICASGTCTLDGTATSAPGFLGRVNWLGNASNSEQFSGNIAEWGYIDSVTTAGIAAWSQCKYGI